MKTNKQFKIIEDLEFRKLQNDRLVKIYEDLAKRYPPVDPEVVGEIYYYGFDSKFIEEYLEACAIVNQI